MPSHEDRTPAKPYEAALSAALRRARRALLRRGEVAALAQGVCEALAGDEGPFDAAVVAWTDTQGLTLPIGAAGLEGDPLLVLVCEALADDEVLKAGGTWAAAGGALPRGVAEAGFAWLSAQAVPGCAGERGKLALLARTAVNGAPLRGPLADLAEDLGTAIQHAEEDARQAEELRSLRTDQERLRAILDVAPAAINLTRARDGRYVDVSRGFLDLTGYPRERVLGRTSVDLGIWANPRDRLAFVERLQRDGAVHDFVAPFVDARGETHVGTISARLQELHGEPYIISVTLDITERERSQATLRTILRADPDAVLVLDEESHEVLFANPAGYALRARLSPEELGRLAGEAGAEARDGQLQPDEVTLEAPGEPPRAFSVRRVAIPWDQRRATLVSARDETRRTFQAQALAAIHELSRELFGLEEAVSEDVLGGLAEALDSADAWWFDAIAPERSLTRGDARLERLEGRLRAGAPPPCVEVLRGRGQTVLRGGREGFCATCPARPPASWASIVSPLWDGDELLGVLGIRRPWRDAHDDWYESVLEVAVRALEAALRMARSRARERRAEERAREAERLEALGRLAGGVAHDFNNALTIILGAVGFLERTLSLEGEQRDDLRAIRDASNRAAALTAKLLAYSRRQVMRRQPFDCNDRLRGLQELIERLVGEDIELTVQPSPDPLPVYADGQELERAIMNLVTNARSAMPDGGRLLLALSRAELRDEDLRALRDDPHSVVSSRATPGRFAVVVVADTGHGIDGETLPRVFEPFFTTRAMGEGTGLGLSMVEGILHQSGGFVSIQSRPGAGTRVALHVPLHVPTELGEGLRTRGHPWASAEAREVPAPRSERASILVVEDDPNIRRVMLRVLRAAGHDVRGADGLQEAAAVLEEGFPVALLVSDVVMRGGSGVDVANLVRARRPEARILYVSGYPRNELHRRGALDGRAEVLSKPFLPDELREVVTRILAG